MYRRRHSPYSRIDDIQRSRSELVLLVIVSVFAGVLLNMLAAALYDWLLLTVRAAPVQIVLFVLAVVTTLALLAWVAYWLFGRRSSQHVIIEIAIPYHIPDNAYLAVAEQHPYRPRYQVAWQARTLFSVCFPPKGPDAQALAEDYRQARSQEVPFQQWLAGVHYELVEALLVFALHRTGEHALGAEAKFGVWHVPLESRPHTFDDLPEVLKKNAFLRETIGKKQRWKLLLPEGVCWQAEKGDGRFTMRLEKPGSGRVVIRHTPHIWASTQQRQPGQVLGEKLPQDDRSTFYVLGSRLEAWADFEWSFVPNRDDFHNWAVGLLAQLEEALDWGFFLRSRADRIIWDLSWKVGDLPRRDVSLWDKLEAIEQRLAEQGGASGQGEM